MDELCRREFVLVIFELIKDYQEKEVSIIYDKYNEEYIKNKLIDAWNKKDLKKFNRFFK